MAKIVIIGGGISGLSAGIFARLSGLSTEIYESNSKVGGECISWTRGDYTFDGSVQWLMGTHEGTDLNKLWHTLRAFKNEDVIVKEPFLTIEDHGKKIHVFRDIQKTENEWTETFPEDKKLIKEFFGYSKKAKGFTSPVNKNMTEMNLIDFMKMGSKMAGMSGLMMKYGKTNGVDYLNKYNSTMIKNALKTLALPVYPAYSAPAIMGALYGDDGGWPKGGSARISENLRKRFEELGGTIYTKAAVKSIIVENEDAIGIELESGKRVKADYVVPATDMNVTLNKLLGGKYNDSSFETIFNGGKNQEYAFGTCVYVGLGVNADLAEYDSPLVTTLDENLQIGKETVEDIHLTNYCRMPEYAPEGKSVIKCVIQLYDYDYWETLYQNKDAYENEKKRIADAVIKHVEKIYPASNGKIEEITVATPVTYNRFCGAYKGAWMGYAANAKAKLTNHSCQIKGINHLALAGQWLSTPGGLPIAAATGKFAIQEVCEKLKIDFQEE